MKIFSELVGRHLADFPNSMPYQRVAYYPMQYDDSNVAHSARYIIIHKAHSSYFAVKLCQYELIHLIMYNLMTII